MFPDLVYLQDIGMIEIGHTARLRHIPGDEMWKPFRQEGRQNLDCDDGTFSCVFSSINGPQAAMTKELNHLASAKLLAQ